MPIPRRCSPVSAGAARLEAERQAYMERLFQDTVGFAAAKIIRRILGLAHNIDFEWIEDARLRADLRGAKPAARPRDAGGHAVVPHDRRRDEGGARVARLAAGFRPLTDVKSLGSDQTEADYRPAMLIPRLARNRCA